MARVEFDNGVVVEFEGNPTPEDIEEVSAKVYQQKDKNFGFNAPAIASKITQQAGGLLTKPFDIPYATRPLEQAGEMVNRSVQDVAGRTAEAGQPVTGTLMSMLGETGKLTPSNLAGMIGGESVGRIAPSISLPAISSPLRSPKTAEQGISTAIKGLGKEGVNEILMGNTIKSAHELKTSKLFNDESSKWNDLMDKHGDIPQSLVKTKNYIDSIFKERGMLEEQTYLERLNPTLRDVALKSPNPEIEAKKMFDVGKQSVEGRRAFVDPTEINKEVPQLSRGMKVLQKIYEASNSSDLTLANIKPLKTEIGYIIKSHGERGTQMEHVLKNVYKNMSEDIVDSTKATGIESKFKAANQSTKDYFKYVDLPSSQIIKNTDYPEDLVDKLIKTDSPTRAKELFNEHDLSKEQQDLIRQGLINKVIKKSATETGKGTKIDIGDLAREFSKWDDDWIGQVYGKDSQTVKSIKDASITYADFLKGSQSGRSLPTREGYFLSYIMRKFRQLRVAPEVYNMLKRTQGPEIATKMVVPTIQSRTIRPYPPTRGGSVPVAIGINEDNK